MVSSISLQGLMGGIAAWRMAAAGGAWLATDAQRDCASYSSSSSSSVDSAGTASVMELVTLAAPGPPATGLPKLPVVLSCRYAANGSCGNGAGRQVGAELLAG